MKLGKNLQALATEIQRRAASKRDLVSPVAKMSFVLDSSGETPQPLLAVAGHDALPIAPIAHQQLIEFTKIPGDYYKMLLREDPELLIENMNKRIRRVPEKRRLVRVLDDKVRAVLSDTYRRYDNEDFAEAVLPTLQEMGLVILSMELTDTRLYFKAVDSNILVNVPTGKAMGDGENNFFDTLSPAISVSNSEVGLGALQVETGTFTRACTNLCLFGAMLRRYHTGKRMEVSDETYALLTDATKAAADKAVWMQTQDVIRGAFNLEKFTALTDKVASAAQDPLHEDVVEVVKQVTKRYTLSDAERKGILTHLIKGGDLTRYGLHAAVTRAAEDLDDYDRATSFEELGGDLINLPKDQWKALNRPLKEAA